MKIDKDIKTEDQFIEFVLIEIEKYDESQTFLKFKKNCLLYQKMCCIFKQLHFVSFTPDFLHTVTLF